jgi:hypothetical protein
MMRRTTPTPPPHVAKAIRTGRLTMSALVPMAAVALVLLLTTGGFSLLWVLPWVAVLVTLLVIDGRALRTVRAWGHELDNPDNS